MNKHNGKYCQPPIPKGVHLSDLKELYDAGFISMPLQWDEKNKVAFRHPAHEAKERPTWGTIESWYNEIYPANGLAIKLFPPKGMFDFDLKHSDDKTIYNRWVRTIEATHPNILRKICVEKTRSNGYHAYIHYTGLKNKMMLARNAKGEEVISIYTGLTGLLSYCDPTPDYELIHNNFSDVQELTTDEFDFLCQLCMDFNKYVPKENEFVTGEPIAYPDVHEQLLSQFDRRCTDALFEKLLGIIDLCPTKERPRKKVINGKEITYHYYLREGSTAKSSAKVSFEPKKLFIFSASFPRFPNYHNRGQDESFGLTPSLIVYYAYDKDWKKTRTIIKELCDEHNIHLDEMPPDFIPEEMPPIPHNLTNNNLTNGIGKGEEYLQKFKSTILNQCVDYPLPVPVINIIQRGEIIPLLTLKSFSLWQGKQKSMKTTLLALMVAVVIGVIKQVTGIGTFLQAVGNGTVLWFDTEQGESYAARTMKLILKLAGVETSSRLIFCDLKLFSPDERLKIIIAAIEATPDAKLVIIDGLVDLLNDFREPKDAHLTMTQINRICANYNVHVAGILHQNKGDKNPREIIGTISQQKCEVEISVERDLQDKLLSFVECVNSRGLPFEKFAIRWDKGHLPKIDNQWSEALAEDQKTARNYEKAKQLAEAVFKPLKSYSFTEATNEIMKKSKKSMSTAKRKLEEFQIWGFVEQGEDGLYRIKVLVHERSNDGS